MISSTSMRVSIHMMIQAIRVSTWILEMFIEVVMTKSGPRIQIIPHHQQVCNI